MSVFIVALESGTDLSKVDNCLKQKSIAHYKVSDSTYLMSYNGVSTQLKDELNIMGTAASDVSGAVFALGNGYAGFANKGLWEWLEKNGG